MRLSQEMIEEISSILLPTYNKDAFLAFLKKHEGKNPRLAYDILIAIQGNEFEDPDVKTPNYPAMLTDLMCTTQLTWDQVNECELSDHEEDSSCDVHSISCFIGAFFLEEDSETIDPIEQCALILLQHWKNDIAEEEIRALFIINEFRLIGEGELFVTNINYNPSLIIREYLLQHYSDELGMNELLPFLVNAIRTHLNLTQNNDWPTYLGTALDKDCSFKHQNDKILVQIEQQSNNEALKKGIARFRALIKEFSNKADVGEALIYIAECGYNNAYRGLVDHEPSRNADLEPLLAILYRSLIASYSSMKVLRAIEFKIQQGKITAAPVPPKQQYINTAKQYLENRWYSDWLIESGLGSIVWFFSPLQWSKVTLTIAFIKALETEENPDLLAKYTVLKSQIEKAVIDYKPKKQGFFQCFSSPESVENNDDGKWAEIFNF